MSSTYQQRMAEFTRANARVQFYKSIGRPDLAQKYEPFDVPAGMKIQEIQETKKGLQVSFYDPNAKPDTQTPKAQQPTKPMDSQEALERKQFYTRLGKPELAEKYDVFDVPAGASVHLRETKAGLEVTFYDPVQRAMQLDKYQKSKQFFEGIGHGKYGGRYEPFAIPEGHRVGDIVETSEGLNITFIDVAAEAKQQTEIKKSVDFFTSIGYPQFGGKYAPFDIPEGHHVGEIAEAEGSLKISFHDTIAEEMYRQRMEIENPQIAGISRNYQQYLISGGLERQAMYAQPKQTVISTLPKSDYWLTPTPETIGKIGPLAPNAQVTKIEPPLGYRVTNIQPTIIEGKEAVTYDITPIAQTTQHQEKGFAENLFSGLSKTTLNLKHSLPSLGVPVADLLTQQEKSAVQTTGLFAVAALTPVAGPIVGLSAKAVATNVLLGVGISQGFKAVQGGGLLTPEEAAQSAVIGGAFSIVSAGVFKGVGKVAPTVAASIIGRTSLSAAIGAGGGYVLSGGSLEEAGKGALFGAGLGLGSEAIGALATRIKTKFPSESGGYPKFTQGETTIGSSGQKIQTLISEPVKELGGKQIRLVPDVTELPVGSKGVSLGSLVDDYINRKIPTSHATLTPEHFNLKAGGETLLKGFPEMSKGFRSTEQLYHFYSAPGSDDFITVYGGYAGIGKGYSGPSKVMFGGKPTALITLDTKVSPEFLRLPKESQSAFLSRISGLSGKTGLAPETLLGKSMERQLITPAAYERFGVQLPGSKFISEGKIGTFIVETKPTGLIGKTPILKTIFTKYQTLDIVKGKYAPTTTTATAVSKTLDTVKYGSSYGRTISVSDKFAVSPSTIIKPFVPSTSQSTQSISKTVSLVSTSSTSRVKEASKSTSQMLISLKPSIIKISEPTSLTSTFKSLTSTPKSISTSTSKIKSEFASRSISLTPSISKISSQSREYSPSIAYTPSFSTSTVNRRTKTQKLGLAPTFQFMGGKGKRGKDSFSGEWFKYKNPIKTPKRILKDFQSFGSNRMVRNNPLLNFNLQTKRKRRRR